MKIHEDDDTKDANADEREVDVKDPSLVRCQLSEEKIKVRELYGFLPMMRHQQMRLQ